jgi:hypothetical protein
MVVHKIRRMAMELEFRHTNPPATFSRLPEGHALMQDTGVIRQFRPRAGRTKEVRP